MIRSGSIMPFLRAKILNKIRNRWCPAEQIWSANYFYLILLTKVDNFYCGFRHFVTDGMVTIASHHTCTWSATDRVALHCCDIHNYTVWHGPYLVPSKGFAYTISEPPKSSRVPHVARHYRPSQRRAALLHIPLLKVEATRRKHSPNDCPCMKIEHPRRSHRIHKQHQPIYWTRD